MYLTCYQCVVVFEKNATTVQKLAWGAVPLKTRCLFSTELLGQITILQTKTNNQTKYKQKQTQKQRWVLK